MIHQQLLGVLVCPECKKKVQLNEQQDGLICMDCKLVYEIKNDIPIMLVDDAKQFDDKNGVF